MSESKIEWTEYTWNPLSGCRKCDPGCQHCYAERLAMTRLRERSEHLGIINENGWTGNVVVDEKKLRRRWQKPRLVFVNSMADTFYGGDHAIEHYLPLMWRTFAENPHCIFQVLTKRDQAMRLWMYHHGNVLPNVWLGVSASDQGGLERRWNGLRNAGAAVRFVSLEPLIEPVSLSWLPDPDFLNWVIVGGESGPGARPMHPDWVRTIWGECKELGIPFFFKQWGEWIPDDQLDEFGKDVQVEKTRDMGATWCCMGNTHGWRSNIAETHTWRDKITSYRVGKKHAGRHLDDKTWDEYPPEFYEWQKRYGKGANQ